jgi:transketolase
MRRTFADELFSYAMGDERIVLLTGDLGFGMWNDFQIFLPKQYINCGASEQAMLDMAVGMAQSGKIPVCYSITTFLIYRGFETLRTYICHENLHVILVGSGRDQDYEIDGYSHDASDIIGFMNNLPNIRVWWPNTKENIPLIVKQALKEKNPAFISLRR